MLTVSTKVDLLKKIGKFTDRITMRITIRNHWIIFLTLRRILGVDKMYSQSFYVFFEVPTPQCKDLAKKLLSFSRLLTSWTTR